MATRIRRKSKSRSSRGTTKNRIRRTRKMKGGVNFKQMGAALLAMLYGTQARVPNASEKSLLEKTQIDSQDLRELTNKLEGYIEERPNAPIRDYFSKVDIDHNRLAKDFNRAFGDLTLKEYVKSVAGVSLDEYTNDKGEPVLYSGEHLDRVDELRRDKTNAEMAIQKAQTAIKEAAEMEKQIGEIESRPEKSDGWMFGAAGLVGLIAVLKRAAKSTKRESKSVAEAVEAVKQEAAKREQALVKELELLKKEQAEERDRLEFITVEQQRTELAQRKQIQAESYRKAKQKHITIKATIEKLEQLQKDDALSENMARLEGIIEALEKNQHDLDEQERLLFEFKKRMATLNERCQQQMVRLQTMD